VKHAGRTSGFSNNVLVSTVHPRPIEAWGYLTTDPYRYVYLQAPTQITRSPWAFSPDVGCSHPSPQHQPLTLRHITPRASRQMAPQLQSSRSMTAGGPRLSSESYESSPTAPKRGPSHGFSLLGSNCIMRHSFTSMFVAIALSTVACGRSITVQNACSFTIW
jgi:hypothetical protein